MLDVLSALTQRVATRRQSADELLVDAAKRTANNERPDLEAVDQALRDTGRTPEHFAELVELCRKRAKWVGDMNKGPAATAAHAKAKAAHAKAEAEFIVVRDAWHKQATELAAQIDTAAATVARARDARQALCHPDNVPGPLADRIREAHAAVETAQGDVSRITRDQQQQRDRQATERDWADRKRSLNGGGGHTNTTADEHDRNAARAARRLAELDQELAAANAALSAATAELEKLESQAVKT